jgi:hypothetical protein
MQPFSAQIWSMGAAPFSSGSLMMYFPFLVLVLVVDLVLGEVLVLVADLVLVIVVSFSFSHNCAYHIAN